MLDASVGSKETKFPAIANFEYETLPSDSLAQTEFEWLCVGKVLLGTPEIRKSLKGDLGCIMPDGGGFTRAAVHRLGADGYGLGADGYGFTVATCRQTVDTQRTDRGGRVKTEDQWLFAEIVVLPGVSIKDLGAFFEKVLKHPLW